MEKTLVKSFAVLLAGGSGTRLWPISRELFPKQLVKFFGNQSLIQHSVKRLLPSFDIQEIKVVCGQKHSSEITRDLSTLDNFNPKAVIQEPCGRNTAPAILLSVLEILKNETDAIIFIFPADHVIKDQDEFQKQIKNAFKSASDGYIVTFGITPDYPETGYGYIEASENKIDKAFLIKRFVEKPDHERAVQYLKAGNFFWNSGMFAFKASVLIKEFEKSCPEILNALNKIMTNDNLNFETYNKIDNISFDYAIMEHTKKGVVLPSSFGWSDIGSWKSLYDFLPKDSEKNAVATGDVILQNTKNSFIMGHDRLVAVNNLNNIVVVETPDSLFVSDLENSREVKSIVTGLKEKGRREYMVHTTIYHPWGKEKILEDSNDITIKKIVLYPKANTQRNTLNGNKKKIVLTNGSLEYCVEQKTQTISKDSTVNIPENKTCYLKNPEKNEVSIIEIEIREIKK